MIEKLIHLLFSLGTVIYKGDEAPGTKIAAQKRSFKRRRTSADSASPATPVPTHMPGVAAEAAEDDMTRHK